MINNLIKQLEKLTNNQVQLMEDQTNIDKTLKKRFYGVSADFEKDLNRLIAFYNWVTPQHPELKSSLKKLVRLQTAFQSIFSETEAFLDKDKPLMNEVIEDKEVKVGSDAQVYEKGQAFIGPLIAYGNVKGHQGRNDESFQISFDYYEPTMDPYDIGNSGDKKEKDRTWYDSREYDIVRVNVQKPTFEKVYKKKQLAEADPIEAPTKPEEKKVEPTTDPTIPEPASGTEVPEQPESPVSAPDSEPDLTPSMESDPKTFTTVAQETKDSISLIQKYVQPDEKDVATARKKIYDEFLSILTRYNAEIPLAVSKTPIETLQSLNAELKSFIQSYEIPTE